MRDVVGLDLSLTATGVATSDGSWIVKPGKLRGPERLATIRDFVAAAVLDEPVPVDLVVIEGYAYGRNNNREILGELGGVIRLLLWENDVRYLDVPPSTLKMYATGKGNAGKTEVVIAARERLGYSGHDDNEADAMWLYALGCDLLGQPLVKLPQTHRRALEKLEVPS